jgi:HAMP domain-containing protein
MGRKIIFAFITYSLIISFTLGFISLFALKNTLENLINKHLIQTKIMANSLDFIIQNNLNRLYDISLSGAIDLKNNLDDEKLALKNAYTYSLFSEGILLLDNNGKIITGYPEVYTYIKTISFRKYINKVSYYKKPLITPLYYIRDISKNLIFAMLPFRDSVGNINGIICGIINIAGTQINEFFNVNNILMNHNLLQLIDNTGNTIYSSVKQKKYDNLLHSKYIIKLNKNIQNNKYGIFKIKNKDTQICTYASLQYAPWKIISCQASKVVYNPVKYLLNFFILITTIYILTGLIFATGLSKGIISPVRSLIDETKAIAAGDLSKELNTAGGYEIDELAQSFENMRKKLKESIESIQSYNEKLESMVLERTEELEKNKNKIESLLGLIMSSQEE